MVTWTRQRGRVRPPTKWALACAWVATLALAACNSQTPSLLIKITGDAPAELLDVYLRDDASGAIFFHSGFNAVVGPVGGRQGPIDLTQVPLKIAVRLSSGGALTVLLVGAIGPLVDGKPSEAGQLFWAGHVEVRGVTELDARLLSVPSGDDQDRDLWPDAGDFRAHVPEAEARYATQPELLDCDDKLDNPTTASGASIMKRADQINPYAFEICNDGYDERCNGDADEPCIDADGDGDPSSSDCDDHDPARHQPTGSDPFPDPPNCCGYNLGKTGTADEKKSFAGDPGLCPTMRCGDQIDESCRGGGPNLASNDTACVIDADCDGFPAMPQGTDCDDMNAGIHLGAIEICNNGINESCNALGPDVGCVPCDLDGDGYERSDVAAGCPDTKNQHPGLFDCNDEDAGIYPGAALVAGGKEGGSGAVGRLATSLKGLCRTVYEPTTSGNTPKVAAMGSLIGDADCNGAAFEGCPPSSCDADGDGWPKDACGALNLPAPYDCNDADPTIYPGAHDKCGDGINGDCSTGDTACNGLDKDGDGYLPPSDCDDTNPKVHPFALETCNGVDDDCDGDIDEGNPDPSGKPLILAGAIATCTDSNIGECGKQVGYCVCSPTVPTGSQNASARVACPGEGASGARSPHCFGAGQPQGQTCEDALTKDEDCDGRVDAPDGKNLLVKGQQCGFAAGVCKPGLVVGCVSTPTKTWYGATPPVGKAHWECSSETIAASPEICNGLDDDCDGALPVDETDPDSDKVLACAPCAPVLASGLVACGDCQPNDPASHPGAVETCDGVDNNCDGTVDETPNSCSALSKTCCFAAGGGCQDLMNDNGFCGACNVSCLNKTSVNVCKLGACICKSSNAACSAGNWCNPANNSGTCESCSTAQRCGPSCLDCTSMVTCANGQLVGGSCVTGNNQCGGSVTCPGSYACASGTTCKTNCASDADCGASLWCKKGAAGANTCAARQSKNTACNDTSCATTGCLQCTGGGGSACPAGAGNRCP